MYWGIKCFPMELLYNMQLMRQTGRRTDRQTEWWWPTVWEAEEVSGSWFFLSTELGCDGGFWRFEEKQKITKYCCSSIKASFYLFIKLFMVHNFHPSETQPIWSEHQHTEHTLSGSEPLVPKETFSRWQFGIFFYFM